MIKYACSTILCLAMVLSGFVCLSVTTGCTGVESEPTGVTPQEEPEDPNYAATENAANK